MVMNVSVLGSEQGAWFGTHPHMMRPFMRGCTVCRQRDTGLDEQ